MFRETDINGNTYKVHIQYTVEGAKAARVKLATEMKNKFERNF